MKKIFGFVSILVLVILSLGIGVVGAADSPKDQKAKPATPSPATPSNDIGYVGEPIEIAGFRSARFGATEEQLLPLIAKDLGVDVKTIQAETNPVERTRAIVAKASNLLPDSGPAVVAYILGATSKKLMQVNVAWTAGGDRVQLEQLAATANALREHLLHKGAYAKGSMAVNAQLPNGTVLVFRGADDKGRLVLLHLSLLAPPDKDAKESLPAGGTLELSYIENPATPDVLKLAPRPSDAGFSDLPGRAAVIHNNRWVGRNIALRRPDSYGCLLIVRRGSARHKP